MLDLAAGDYVFVIGAFDVGIGQFGPTQTDALSTMGFVYELGISGAGNNEGQLTCVLEGQLGIWLHGRLRGAPALLGP